MSDYTSEIPYGYCHCGCGQKTKIAKHSATKYGWIKGEPYKFIFGHTIKQTYSERVESFWSNVNKDGSIPAHMPHLGKCWEWTGSRRKANQEYGSFKWEQVTTPSHRISWILANGEIPDGLWVLHKCDNQKCVNPNHLFLGTCQDNADDRTKKGRNNPCRGEKSAASKLTDNQVITIRQEYAAGITVHELVFKYKVAQPTISAIISNRTWRHLL